jgi:hypothetical protein
MKLSDWFLFWWICFFAGIGVSATSIGGHGWLHTALFVILILVVAIFGLRLWIISNNSPRPRR